MSGVGQIRANRRIVFHGLGALGVAAALAGCAGGDDGEGGGGDGEPVDAGTELTTTDQVPVGGGVILTGPQVVVTQPTEGDFKAYTSVCTHQQLPVTSVEDGVIYCSNHGSEYDAATGEPTLGPAPSALAPVEITVDGDRILTT